MKKPQNHFRLTTSEAAAINAEVNGEGGFQTYLRRLQRGLTGRTLAISDADLGRAVRMMRYGSGGFEGRIYNALARPISEAMVAA